MEMNDQADTAMQPDEAQPSQRTPRGRGHAVDVRLTPDEYAKLTQARRDLGLGSVAEVARYLLGLGVVVEMGEDPVPIGHGSGWRDGYGRAIRAVERMLGAPPGSDEPAPAIEHGRMRIRSWVADSLYTLIQSYRVMHDCPSVRDTVRRLVLAGAAAQREGCGVCDQYIVAHEEGMRRARGAVLARLRCGGGR
jgi:hypothetical protein